MTPVEALAQAIEYIEELLGADRTRSPLLRLLKRVLKKHGGA